MARTATASKPVADAGTPAAKKTAALKKDSAKPATTAVAVKKPTASLVNIAEIQAKLREQAAGMAERTSPASGIKIQVTNKKTFKLPNGQEVDELLACIVDFRVVHNFYEQKFDPKNIVPPACFAIGVNPKDMAPSDNSPNRQAQTCQVCPMNVFGSDGDGKACKNGRRMALLPPTDAGDDVDSDADLWTLDVSPTALKGWDGYVQTLARTYNLPPVGFLTKITFDPNTDYAKLVFSDPVPVQNLVGAYERQAEAAEILSAEPDLSSLNKAAAPKGKPAAAGRGARR